MCLCVCVCVCERERERERENYSRKSFILIITHMLDCDVTAIEVGTDEMSFLFFLFNSCLFSNPLDKNPDSDYSVTGPAFTSITGRGEFSRIFGTIPQHSRSTKGMVTFCFFVLFPRVPSWLLGGHGVIFFNR